MARAQSTKNFPKNFAEISGSRYGFLFVLGFNSEKFSRNFFRAKYFAEIYRSAAE